jgi:hypothetical protein
MMKSQLARLDALRRVQTFLDDNAAALGTVSKSTSRTDLDAAVAKLQSDADQQDKAATEATARTKMKVVARDELRLQHMQPIAAIAKKKLSTAPAIQDLRLPPKNTSDAALVTKGNSMAAAAEPYAQVFIEQQLPADFVAQLRASVQAVLQAVGIRTTAVAKLNETTKNVKDQLAVTHTDVKVLNALVVKQLKGQSGLLTAWKIAKRIKAKPGVPTGSTKPPAILPVPIPAPVPAPVPVPVPAPAPAPAPAPVPAPTPAPTATKAPLAAAA